MVNKYNLLKQELSLHKSELSNLKNTVSINCSLQNEVIRVNLENESLKDEISDLKRVIEKWTCSKVTLDQLLSEQIPGNIVKALGGKGRRKENNPSKEVLFTKADVSTSESAPMITSDSEDDSDIQEPLPPLPKLTGADPSGASKSLISLSDLTANMADLTLNTASKEIKKSSNKVSQTYVIKKQTKSKHPTVQNSCLDKNALPSTEQLLLTLMEEVKGIKKQILIPSDTSSLVSQACSSKTPKQKVWYGPCKHYGMRNHLSDDCYSKPKCSTCGLISHTTKEHTEQYAVTKSLNKLKGHSTSKSTPIRTARMSKTFGECKYYRYSKEPGPKVVFGDDSSGHTEGYVLVNCNGITFTRVAYVNGLKHNLISISQLCDTNFKVLFTKTQRNIFNQNDEVVLIAPRSRDVYIIDIKMENLNEVRVKELRSDNGTESIIVKRHRKTAYDMFRGRAPDISYLHVFGCPVHIHNHMNHLGKFDEKANDGFFLGYSPVAKAFRLFSIRRQEMEEIVYVTFSEDDEAISQTSTEGDAINFNENRSSPNDEFIEPRTKDTQCFVNIEYFPNVFAYENTISAILPTLQNFVTSEEPSEFTIANDLAAIHEPDHAESANILESAEPRDNVLSESISNNQPAPVISPSAEVIHQNPAPQDRRSRDKNIKLVNIIGELLASITTRNKIRDSDAASVHECLYVNFLSEIKPKKLIEALEVEGWVVAMQ
ncbi:retrovirus-related pol polyprotein from transposon TNT 1-94 [Tanacetum coccineum]